MKKLLFLVLFILFCLFSWAQNMNKDSLWKEWNNTQNIDSVKLKAITEIINSYIDNQPDSVCYLGKLKHELALKIKNKNAQYDALSILGKTYYSQGDNTKAMDYFNKCIAIAEELKNDMYLSDTYNDIGNVWIELGNFQKAMVFYLKCLKINEKNNDKERLAVSYMNIGNIDYAQKRTDAALKNYYKALKYNEELDKKNGIADNCINLSAIYAAKGKHTESINFLLRAERLQKETDDQLGLMYTYNNLADNFIKMNELEKAFNMLKKSEKIGIEKNYSPPLSVTYINLADVYVKQNKYAEANAYLNKALVIVEEIEYKEYYKEIYSLFSKIYEKKGDFKKAFEYHQLYANIKDSLLNEESSRQITEMNAKYESEKKEKNIALLTKDKELLNKDIALRISQIEKQKIFNYVFIGILLLAVFLTIILYSRYNTNQKLNTILLAKNEELSQKNNLIENQKEKIIDNITYAKRIQQSILMDEKEIQNYLPNSFIFYLPKDIVSGDFYWCSKIEDNIILAAIDCTGHGVSGAFMSMIGNTLLNQIVNEKHITTPSKILRLLNIGVYEGMNQGKEEGIIARDGMDMALCNINYSTNTLQFAGAQNGLYIMNDNKLETIKGDTHSIGGGEMNANPYKQTYTNHKINITRDMSIYLFSDGYMDQFGGPDRKKFGMQKFRELILISQHLSMKEQKDLFAYTHNNWKGEKESQLDDILLIGVRL